MLIRTSPLGHIHRDILNRVIRVGDYVVWSNSRQGSRMVVCKVEGSSRSKVRLSRTDNQRLTNARPTNLLVITAQIERNIVGNVGANMDLEATRPS